MIKYIINNNHGSLVFDIKTIQYKYSNTHYLKQICTKYLKTLEGYQKSVSKILSIHKMIPLVLSNEHIYFHTKSLKSFDNIWINYNAISNVVSHNKDIKVSFYDGSSIELNISYDCYLNIIKKINVIKNYLYNLI